MLAIATTLVSLTDPGKACPVLCGRENIAEASFAKSFADGSALDGEVQAAGPDGKTLIDASHDGGIASAKTGTPGGAFIVLEVKGAVSAGTTVQDALPIAKGLSESKATVVVPIPNEVKGKAAGVEARPQSGGASENGTAATQTGVSEGQPSSGNVAEVPPKAVSGPVDTSTVISMDEITTLQPDIPDLTRVTNPDPGEKPSIGSQRKISTIEKSSEEVSADKVAKDHSVAVKAGKSEKTEKTDKAARPAEKVGGAGLQATTAMPIEVAPSNGPTPETSAAPDENGIASIASTELKRRVGMAAVADSKAGKKHAGTDKPNAGEIEAQGFSSPECPSSQKPETDEEKNKGAAAATTAGGDSKGLSAAAINLVTVPKHSDGAASMAASATGVGVAVPTPAVGIQSLVSPHTRTVQSGVAMQSGASAIDARTSIDAAPRTLSATPTSLEVGVASGSHGWLKIRAEMGDGGVVNASLSTASSSGQESLHRELPSLAAYLQNERVAVNAVVVQPVVMATDPRGFSGGMNGDGRGQPQQSGGQGGDNRQDAANPAVHRMDNNAPYNRLSGMGNSEQLPLISYARGGSWLSVRA